MYHLSRRLRIVSAVLLLLVATGACRVMPIGTPGAATPASSKKAETPVSDATRTPTPPLPTITSLPAPQEAASPTLSLALDVSTISYQPIFAPFKEPTVRIERAVFQDRPASGLADVLVPFVLTKGQRDRLEKDGLVVGPGMEKEFFTLYEKTRYANVPIFVTSDSLLHIYHLLFDKTLRTAETGYFIPLLRDLNKVLLNEADKQYQVLKGTSWEDAALRTAAYVGVASRLLDAKVRVPDYASKLVNAELDLIKAADGIHPSPIFTGLEFGEDYSQYIPRGHYTRSDALKAYFKAMMWYGRMTFRLKTKDPEVGRAETRSALLLVYALRNVDVKSRPGLDVWADLYDPTVFFVGRSDDLVVIQYASLMDELYGKDVALKALADDAKLDSFIELANQLPAPRILGMVIQATDDEAAMTKGLRFMGQRFVPDAYIFRQLVWRNVGEATVNRRGLPKGLDVLAAMGSERAYRLLDELGDTKYKNYPEQMQKINTWVTGLTPQEWTETLYNSWLYTFHPLLDKYDTSYPRFMQSLAWQDKQLNTVLGSWAELKHDTILLAKQVYAEMGGGGGPPPPEPMLLRGYVEPVPFFYARLAGLAAMTRQGLSERKMLNEQDGNSLQRLEELSLGFKTMAEKELSNKPLTQDEYDAIRYYGGDLEHLTIAAADTDTQDQNAQPMMEEPEAAVIADVATDPDPNGDGKANPSVLEVGVGRVSELYAVVPMTADDGKTFLQVAKGGTFSYYEFPWPADDRLTDEKWRKMLDAGQAPPLQKWTVSFLSEDTSYSELQQAIYAFQTQVNWIYWSASTEYVGFDDQLKAKFQPYADNLKAQNRYEGRQLVSSNYRSFDLQSDSLAVVTVRETWQDGLYKPVEFMGDGESEPIAKRGPYTLDVTYTVEKKDNMWQVTNVVYANEPPPW